MGKTAGIEWKAPAAHRGYTPAHNVVLFDRRLSNGAHRLYLQLAHLAWAKPNPMPTQAELAANLGVNERTLRRYCQELEAVWLLERREQGRGRAVLYLLSEPAEGYLELPQREARAPKRPVENPVENVGETHSSSDTHVRPSSDTHVRPLPYRGEDLEEPRPSKGSSVSEGPATRSRVRFQIETSLRQAGT